MRHSPSFHDPTSGECDASSGEWDLQTSSDAFDLLDPGIPPRRGLKSLATEGGPWRDRSFCAWEGAFPGG